MDPKVLLGTVLIATGVMDLGMAWILPRRLHDPAKQRTMRAALGGGGAMLLVVGTLLATRVL